MAMPHKQSIDPSHLDLLRTSDGLNSDYNSPSV